MDHQRSWLRFIFSIFVLSALSSPVNAAIYKCVNSDGETTFSQTACPQNSKGSRYSKAGSESKKTTSADCRLAQKFAEATGEDMRTGKSSGSVFRQYGGLSSMSGPAVSIVNYVYTFEQNYQTTIERIGGLTRIRCENGSFGETSCEKFPGNFIANAGGCDLSKIKVEDSASRSQSNSHNANTRVVAQRGTSKEEYLLEQAKVSCKTNVLKKLESVDKKTRTGLSATEHDAYRVQRKNLRREFDNC